MDEVEARAALDALIRERREDYSGLSRLIGRNPTYIQQYVKRGSPRRLAEGDRRLLADYFGVPEAALGGLPAPRIDMNKGADFVPVPRFAVAASAGPGALAAAEQAGSAMLFPSALLRELGVGRTQALSLIRVEGDSMLPTLGPGDDILIDADDAVARLRDGIYVLRVGDALIVKRIGLLGDGRVAVRSDNAQAPHWPDMDRAHLAVVGRVVWAGRKLR